MFNLILNLGRWNWVEMPNILMVSECCRNQQSRSQAALRELEDSGLSCWQAGAEELTPQALSSEQRGYKVFIENV